MAWARLDDGYFTHPKCIRAGIEGRALHLAAIAYAARELTDGVIERAVLPMVAVFAGVANPEQVAEMLVSVGLFDQVNGGYRVHDYLDYNPGREAVLAEREAAKARMRKVREQQANKKRSSPEVRPNIDRSSDNPVPTPTPVVDSEPNGSGERHPPQPPKGERVSASRKPDVSGFDEWYAIYPRHVARAAAEKAWAKLGPDERAAAVAAIGRQLDWPAFSDAPPDKIPHPTTWLMQRRWEDEPPNGRHPPGKPPGLPSPTTRGDVPADGGLADYLKRKGAT